MMKERVEEVVYLTDYEDDVGSDLSAFHRIDDPMTISAERYFRLAVRLTAYNGVMAARAAELREDEKRGATGAPAGAHAPSSAERPATVSNDAAFAMLGDWAPEHAEEEVA